jgi:hypothetical protein
MATQERDEFESMAEYYNDRLPIELRKLAEVLNSMPWNMESPQKPDAFSMTYSQFLRLKQAFEAVEQTMHRRDMFGTHSKTGKDRFRHIAHPEQYPAPQEPALV